MKKHSRNEFNFEATTQKCQSLSYFDQHVVTWQCSVTVIEMLNSFATANSNYLPVQEHVAFLFDLMELALNIYGLIDVCIQILKVSLTQFACIGRHNDLSMVILCGTNNRHLNIPEFITEHRPGLKNRIFFKRLFDAILEVINMKKFS